MGSFSKETKDNSYVVIPSENVTKIQFGDPCYIGYQVDGQEFWELTGVSYTTEVSSLEVRKYQYHMAGHLHHALLPLSKLL
ncbi:hypothetical protein DET54_11368 [Paenibacillus pabuli]|uniref:Uncharacterized protein n=1 Tax=Paenibacillus pabuli TaxID=1472 RepID=A0ABX9BFH0_9BACL|nr:hypothetical protein [Paenibacillus pabuli]RAI89785.1 hypothetical protein DET54_11368 [Paenibacillus pabuli]